MKIHQNQSEIINLCTKLPSFNAQTKNKCQNEKNEKSKKSKLK